MTQALCPECGKIGIRHEYVEADTYYHQDTNELHKVQKDKERGKANE